MAAINTLHAALGSPQLPGWVPSGGDPCGKRWQGVQCTGSDIVAMYGDWQTCLLSPGIHDIYWQYQYLAS